MFVRPFAFFAFSMSRNPLSRSHPSRLRQTSFGQSSWAWSGVVLFSTLLLSPVASANLLSALARALPQWAAPAPFTAPPAAPVQTPPRRASEQEAARVLLQSVLEREAEVAETEPYLARPQAVVSVVWPVRAITAYSYVLSSVFPPADAGGLPAPACVRLRASRAPPLV